MNKMKPKLLETKREFADHRSGNDRRMTTSERLEAESQKGEQRQVDRRKHCMHCNSPYAIDLTGIRNCKCRVNALHGSP